MPHPTQKLRSRRVVGLVLLIALAALAVSGAPAADAAPGGIAALGRRVDLHMVVETADGMTVMNWGHDVAQSTPVGYFTPKSGGYVDLNRYGVDAGAWRTSSDGSQTLVTDGRTLDLLTGGETAQGRRAVGYAFERRGTDEMLPVSGGGSTVASNLSAGGAIFSWQHDGVEYVNHWDYGRQVQAALFVFDQSGAWANPTEAGDMWSNVDLPFELRHGSPLASASTSGSTQSTRSVPLEWDPGSVSSVGSPMRPVLWSDVRIGKDLTLGWNGMHGVARYRTVVSVPNTVAGHVEMPTAYVNGEFSRLVGYDAVTGSLTELDPAPFDLGGIDWVPASGVGGVIAARPDGTAAFGIFGRASWAGGQVTSFAAHDFATWTTGGSGPVDYATFKLRALYSGNLPAGTTALDAFVVTGTLDDVLANMRTLAGS